jgi:hypothetical protein
MNGDYMLIEVGANRMMRSYKGIGHLEKKEWMTNHATYIKHELASILVIEDFSAIPRIRSSIFHFYYVPAFMGTSG